MAGKVYKTAQGIQLNIDHLRLINERTIAVGNMQVNARGDSVNADGSIKQPRNTIMKNNYRLNAPLVKDDPNDPSENISDSRPSSVANKNLKPQAPRTPTAKETTPTLLRGSLANSVVGQPPENTDTPETSDLLSLSSNTRTIKRI